MSVIQVHVPRIVKNIKKLNDYMDKHGKEWTLIQKVLGSNKDVLKELLKSKEIKRLHSVGDSHLSGLKAVKEIDPSIVTMYIKPPAIKYVENVIKYADISLNTTFNTIEVLNEEAKRQGKIHKVIIMIEMGELREGIVRENILEFYGRIFELENIEVIGLGTNLGCMYGVEPTYDKLIQLCLYEQLVEARFNKKMGYISGGSSITLPLIGNKKIPAGVNHFRIGEAAFLGTSPLNNKKFRNLSTATFHLKANIVELYKKDNQPDGKISEGNVGHTAELEIDSRSHRAIVDFGSLDVDPKNVSPRSKGIKFFGNSSDMTVYDIGSNPKNLKAGDVITFNLSYMAVAKLMNSRFVDKQVQKYKGD